MFIQLTNHQYLQPNQRSLYIEEECYLESMTLTSDLVMRFRSRYVNLKREYKMWGKMKITLFLKRQAYKIKKNNKNRNYHNIGTFSSPHRQIMQIDIPTMHEGLLDQSWLQVLQ